MAAHTHTIYAVLVAAFIGAVTVVPRASGGSAGILESVTAIALERAADTASIATRGEGDRHVVFIPGLGQPPASYEALIASVAQTHTVHVVTMPRSPGDAGDALKNTANQIAAHLKDNGIQRATAAGHSMGGTLAIMLAIAHPQQIEAVVSIDGPPAYPVPELDPTASPRERLNYVDTAVAPGVRAVPDEAWMSLWTTQIEQVVPGLRGETLAKAFSASRPDAIRNLFLELMRLDLRPALADVTVPIFVAAPEAPRSSGNDAASQKERWDRALRDAESATVQYFSDTDHFLHEDHLEAIAAMIRQAATPAPAPARPNSPGTGGRP
ncbi:MAG: alpha/beta hydrolase [Planctomycetota bacterium]